MSVLSVVPAPQRSALPAGEAGPLRMVLAGAAGAAAAALALPVASAELAGTGLAGTDLHLLLVLAAVLWPLATAAVVVALALVQGTARPDGPPAPVEVPATLLGALLAAVPVAAAVPVLERVLGVGAPLPVATRAAGAVLPAAVALVLVVLAPRPAPTARGGRRAVLLLAASGLVASLAPLEPAVAATAAALPAPCTAGTTADRTYDVVALNVSIPYNRWGMKVAHGAVYVLKQDEQAVRNWALPLNGGAGGSAALHPENDPAANRRLRPRPLVLRADAGECVQVRFTNALDATQAEDGMPAAPRASLQVDGPAYDADSSEGAAVGFDADTSVALGGTTTYRWRVPSAEGLFLFHDGAMPAGAEHDAGLRGAGLFGALAVEPAGSTWSDPVSGGVLSDAPAYSKVAGQSGELYVDAVIKPPTGVAFRESVQLGQDEIPGKALGFNYGSEPLRDREANRCGDCLGEETWLSSWPYGDPAAVKLASGPGPWYPNWSTKYVSPDGNAADDSPEDCGLPDGCWTTNVTHSYKGDPTKIRFALAGSKETHIFHLHAHQWLAEPADTGTAGNPGAPTTPSATRKPESQTIDSQTFGPGDAFTADLLFGAGSKNGTFGDSIYHCHLYPHFADGFWNLLRVHDVREDGTGLLPDGSRVRALLPLADRTPLPSPTATNPGYPRMLPGTYGWRAPQPALGVSQPNGTADDPATLVREDLEPAPRIVAGKAIAADKAAVEQAVMDRGNGGKPGSPYNDPCPSGARQVTYDVSVLQRDLVYNKGGDHDTQGRLFVLTRDVAAVLAGTKTPEPLFFRVNAGDCINYRLTNMLPNWVGGDAFLQLTQTNMVGQHIHLVKFDVTASDGASNGWNYQEAAFSREQADHDRAVLAGTQSCTATDCRVADPATWDPTTATSRAMTGQTITERWYADYELRTVFTHDHHFAAIDQNRGLYGALVVEPAGVDFRDPAGTYQSPVNDPAHGTVCGASCGGSAAGATYDVVGPGANDDFREFGLAVADFVPNLKAGGDPRSRTDSLSAPAVPEAFPDKDPGVMSVNYRNEPFRQRERLNGVPVDPAYRFSSTVFGDPSTPLLQAYAGDNVRMRVVQGSQEEGHALAVSGMKWREEPDDPQSPYVASQTLGISEAFTFQVPGLDCAATDQICLGDHLYSSGATDDVYLGMWGIFRVHGKGWAGLRPLPDNVPNATKSRGTGSTTGSPPPASSGKGSPCPSTAPLRSYSVVAMAKDIGYDEQGDHDPRGLMYALADHEAAIAAGTERPRPLTLRASAGECVEVTLTNHLPASVVDHVPGQDGDPVLPTELPGAQAGLRVSLHPQLVEYDVRGSDGATVGYNDDQTVGPGQSTTYRWYATPTAVGELGAADLLDYGDVRGHRHHGLFGALVVEPAGSTWTDPVTGAVATGPAADVHPASGAAFREFTTEFQDGLNLVDKTGAQVADSVSVPDVPGQPAEPKDAEDQGEKGISYGTALFARRLGYSPSTAVPGLPAEAWAGVFSTPLHGDPATPLFRAYAGDPVRVRLLQGADKPRMHSFTLRGHSWRNQPDDPGSTTIASKGGFTVGRAYTAQIAALNGPGDWRYGCQVANHHMSGGLWGLVRAYAPPTGPFVLDPLAAQDDPRTAGYHPIRSLDPAQTAVSAGSAVASSWRTLTGTATGAVAALAADDSSYLTVAAAKSGGAYLADGYGSVTVPAGQRTLSGLSVVYDGGATATGGTRSLQLYDFRAAAWVQLEQVAQPTADLRSKVDATGDPTRFVSSTGVVQARVQTTSKAAVAAKADLLSVGWTYR